jgi:choline dehydrogenase-like flavoprotein
MGCVMCFCQRWCSSDQAITLDCHSLCGWGAGACRDNLKVIQDVTVSKVLIAGSTAIGVQFLEGNSSNPKILLAAMEVILSAGVYGSSKILMVRPWCLRF